MRNLKFVQITLVRIKSDMKVFGFMTRGLPVQLQCPLTTNRHCCPADPNVLRFFAAAYSSYNQRYVQLSLHKYSTAFTSTMKKLVATFEIN